MIIITLLGEFTDLNTYIQAERTNRFMGAKIKKQNTDNALKQLTLKYKAKNYPVRMTFSWYTRDLRKDPDNVAFAKKYILDALVTKGILAGDTRKHIAGFDDNFRLDKKNPRVNICISE